MHWESHLFSIAEKYAAEEAASSFFPTTKISKAEEAAFDPCGDEHEAMDAAAASGEAEARGAAEHMKKQHRDSEASVDFGGSETSEDIEASDVGEDGAPAAHGDDAKAPTLKQAKSNESAKVNKAMDAAAASGDAEARGVAEHIK